MPWEKQFDVETALERAMEAFWAHGYEGTSTQDLVDCMGINRGSLYDTYGHKHDLFVSVLGHYEATYQRPRLATVSEGRSPRGAIGALFDSVVADAFSERGRSGCLLVNTALDMAPHDKEVSRLVGDGLRRIEDWFQGRIEAGQETGDIDHAIDAADTARALLGLLIGVRVLARSLPTKTRLGAIAAQAKAMLG